MKIIFLFIIVQTFVSTLPAQNLNTNNPQRTQPVRTLNNIQEYQGYTIRLEPAKAGGLNFYFLKDNRIIPHRFQNPLPFSERGIEREEDAYKIAHWIINEYLKTGHWQNMMPPHIARQLGIQLSHQIQKN
jgi:hypothetical protein